MVAEAEVEVVAEAGVEVLVEKSDIKKLSMESIAVVVGDGIGCWMGVDGSKYLCTNKRGQKVK